MKNKIYYLYKKDKRDIIPVEDAELNEMAKERIRDILSHPETYNVPLWVQNHNGHIALFQSAGKVEKATSLYIVEKESVYDLKNSLNDLTSKEWLPETVTVFMQRGLGASHKEAQIEKLHPAPYSYQDVARHIRFFTKEGECVLDPFVGVGSTLKAACLENRCGVGVELNPKYSELAKKRIEVEIPFLYPYKDKQTVICGNALVELPKMQEDSFDFVMTSPPYWNILDTKDHKANLRDEQDLDTKYSESEEDLANIISYDDFLTQLCVVFGECSRVLKRNKYIAIVVSDFRKSEKYYMFHSDLAYKLEAETHFVLKGIKILYQNHKSIYPYGYPFSFVPNVHHQYVLILRNEK